MPVTWSLSDDGRMLTVAGRGVVTEAEYFGAHAEFFAATSGAVQPGRVLADWTDVTEIRISSDSLWRSTSMTREQQGPRLQGGRMALVASSPSVYGMCRQWQAMIADTGLECLVFADRDAARAWLLRP